MNKRKSISMAIGAFMLIAMAVGMFAPIDEAYADTDGDYTYTVDLVSSTATITGYSGPETVLAILKNIPL